MNFKITRLLRSVLPLALLSLTACSGGGGGGTYAAIAEEYFQARSPGEKDLKFN